MAFQPTERLHLGAEAEVWRVSGSVVQRYESNDDRVPGATPIWTTASGCDA